MMEKENTFTSKGAITKFAKYHPNLKAFEEAMAALSSASKEIKIHEPHQIYKTKSNSYYTLDVQGKRRYLYRSGNFKSFLKSYKEEVQKEIQSIINKDLGVVEKIKVSFDITLYGKEETKFDKIKYKQLLESYTTTSGVTILCRPHRSYHQTAELPKDVITRLTEKYNADQSGLSQVLPISHNFIKELSEYFEDRLAKTLVTLDSILFYAKITELKTVDADANFSPLDTPLKKEGYLEQKIMSKAIDYPGKNLEEMLAPTKSLNRILGRSYKPDACVYTLLIKLYNEHIKLGRASKTRSNEMTYESLKEFFEPTSSKLSPKPSQTCLGKMEVHEDFSLSINQLSKFFIQFRIEATILDTTGAIIYKYKPETRNKKVSCSHFKVVVTNNHIYHIDVQLNKMNTSEGELYTAEFYNIKKSKAAEVYITDKAELLTYNFEKGVYKVYYPYDLVELLHWFKHELNYHPTVSVSGYLNKIMIKVNGAFVIITHHDCGQDLDNAEVRFHPSSKTGEALDVNYMRNYKTKEKLFLDTLLSREHLSIYSNSLQKNLYEFPINAAVGSLIPEKLLDQLEGCNLIKKLDMKKAYSNALKNSKFIPVATPFDEFEAYAGEDIVDHHLYIIHGKFHPIYSAEKYRITYGVNFRAAYLHLPKQTWHKMILSCCKLNKTCENDKLSDVMDAVKDGLDEKDWKFIFNMGIGLTGKKYNQAKRGYLFDNVDEAAASTKSPNFPMVISLPENWAVYYTEEVGEKKSLKSGFYLIQALIYDTVRTNLMIAHNRLFDSCYMLGVRTDCLYFIPKQSLEWEEDCLDQVELDIANMSPLLKGLGTEFKKIESACFDELPKKQISSSSSDFFNKLKNAGGLGKIPEIVPRQKHKKLHLKDEFDINSFDVLKNMTLLRGCLPGSGKTTNPILWAAKNNKKILVVAPTNALAHSIHLDHNIDAITFSSLVGTVITDEGDEMNKRHYDISKYDVVLIDEIYSLTTGDLYKLKKFIEKEQEEQVEKEVMFLAAGDPLQNKPIEYVNDVGIYNRIVEDLFYNHITLKNPEELRMWLR